MVTFRSLYASRTKVLTYLPFVFLGLTALYSSLYANYYMSGNADDIIYPYLFGHFKLHDIVLPSQHSNILKFPLFIFQSLLPYNFTTLSIIGIGLVLVTILLWAALLARIFGKRYILMICLVFVALLLGSPAFNNQIYGTTIRNIEYPIVLGFTICVGLLASRRTLPKRLRIVTLIMGLLFALTVAGDSFFLYTASVSLLLALASFWVSRSRANKSSHNYVQAAGLVVVASALALIIREGVKVTGIALYHTDTAYLPHILPLNHLGPSISTALTQFLDLYGANIFDQKMTPTNSLVFLNFGLFLLGLAGLVYILADTLRQVQQKEVLRRIGFVRLFALGSITLTGILTFLFYVASDQVVTESPTGVITSAGQERYLTLLPFLVVVGVVYIVWRKHDAKRVVTLGLPLTILSIIALCSLTIKHSHVFDSGLRTDPIAIASSAKANHIPLLVTGYWYASATQLWSGGTVKFAAVGSCNVPTPPINNRLSWYQSSKTIHKSALVVGHAGIDAIYSTCPDSQLIAIYGTPTKVIPVKGSRDASLWVYDYDIRSKLTQFVW